VFRTDHHTVKTFTSLTEMRVIHTLCTFGKSFCLVADITGDSGYVVHDKVTATLL